jgi:hypothetical protein
MLFLPQIRNEDSPHAWLVIDDQYPAHFRLSEARLSCWLPAEFQSKNIPAPAR